MNRVRKHRVVGRNYETVERALKTEIDTRRESKGVGRLGWFMSDINRNIPTT